MLVFFGLRSACMSRKLTKVNRVYPLGGQYETNPCEGLMDKMNRWMEGWMDE